jgi:hypothetical protein
MRFQLMGNWPVRDFSVPAGTRLEFVSADPDRPEGLDWNGIRLPLPAPVNAQALDQEAERLQAVWAVN